MGARQQLAVLLNGAVWHNVHALPHGVLVYEARQSQGYGARWTADGTVRTNACIATSRPRVCSCSEASWSRRCRMATWYVCGVGGSVHDVKTGGMAALVGGGTPEEWVPSQALGVRGKPLGDGRQRYKGVPALPRGVCGVM